LTKPVLNWARKLSLGGSW